MAKKWTARVTRVLAGALLLGATLLAAAPAKAAPSAEAAVAPPAPNLLSATINDARTAVHLIWEPLAAGDPTRTYDFYANGRRFRTLTALQGNKFGVHLADFGLTGNEVFTMVGKDAAGNVSPPSNGLVPVRPGTLPAIELTSAVLNESAGEVTLTWTPSRTREEFGPIGYGIYADGVAIASSLSTTITFPLLFDPLRPPLSGDEVFTVRASDFTFATSPMSNGMVATRS